MTAASRRSLRVLSVALVFYAVAAAAALLVPAGSGDDGAATPTPAPTAPPLTTTVPETTAPAAAPTTSTPSAPTTTVVRSAAPLTTDDVRQTVAPAVGFVTTVNGTGSGVLIEDNLVVTNAHVVWPFDRAQVLFPGARSRRTATVVALDAFSDIAILEIEGRSPLPDPARIGEAAAITAADDLFVVGYPSPEDFGPEVVIDTTSLVQVLDWPYSGVRWIETDAPAVGGQSGGALVNDRGEVVAITTFGNRERLYGSWIEDVLDVVRRLEAGELREGSGYRPFPRSGGRWDAQVALDGPWDQLLYAAWLNAGVTTEITAAVPQGDGVAIDGVDIGFGVIDTGIGTAAITWFGTLPGFVAIEAPAAGTVEWSSIHPLSLFRDPDHGRTLVPGEPMVGIFDVPTDRDFYYLDVAEAGRLLEVTAAMRSRARLTVWDPGGAVVERVREPRGFFFGDPALTFEARQPGRYVIAIQEVGAEVGPYELVVE